MVSSIPESWLPSENVSNCRPITRHSCRRCDQARPGPPWTRGLCPAPRTLRPASTLQHPQWLQDLQLRLGSSRAVRLKMVKVRRQRVSLVLYNTDYSLLQMSVLVPSLESRLGEDLLPSREVPGAGNLRKDPYRASTHPSLAPGTRMGRASGLLRGEVTTATTHLRINLIKITPPIR